MELDGLLGIPSGQITDDGELTICLLQSLVSMHQKYKQFENKSTMPFIMWYESPSYLYNIWYESNPVDCGETCKNAFCFNSDEKQISESIKYNMDSQSNGALTVSYTHLTLPTNREV